MSAETSRERGSLACFVIRASVEPRSRESKPGCLVPAGYSPSVEKPGVFLPQVLFRRLDDEVDADPRAIPDVDEAVLDDRVGQAFDNVVPPGRIDPGVLER